MTYRSRPITTLYFRNGKRIATGHSCSVESAVVAAVRKNIRYTSAQICNGHGIMKAEVRKGPDEFTTITRRFK